MTQTDPQPYRYVDGDSFCLSARLLPDLNTGGVTETLSITIEGSDEPQSVHVRASDAPTVAAGIVRAAGQQPATPAGPAPATDRDTEELTADEARALVDELSTDLYRAQDALAFVEECCVIADREGRQPTTADVREWLKGARCGRQLLADAVLPAPDQQTAVLLWAADQIDAETRQAKADGVLEPDKFRPCRDVSAQLRRLACPTPETHNWGCGCPTDQLPLHAESGVDTPGCDCGHDGMGPKWHARACAWLATMTVPHPDEVLRRLAGGAQQDEADAATAEHHTVDGIRYLCHTDDHYCPRAAQQDQPQPQRGDRFEQWLTAQRDAHRDTGRGVWTVLDNLLDLYRLHADTGTPLTEHVCEGQAVGDCGCLEQPTAVARSGQPETDEDEELVHVGWWCWRGDNHGHLATMACRSDNVPIHVPAEWADEMRAVLQRIEDGDEPETDEETLVVPCSLSVLKRRHGVHRWEPQPGMDPVRCPGYSPPSA